MRKLGRRSITTEFWLFIRFSAKSGNKNKGAILKEEKQGGWSNVISRNLRYER